MKYKYKITKTRGIEYKFSAEWIYALESEEHWRLYWNQQKMIQKYVRHGENILEIGAGSGFTADYLKSKGFNVTTLDIDSDKNPDIVCNIVEYEFPDIYDHILAFEVFEHIPFVEFKKVINKISHACSKYVFLSVPRNEKVWLRLDCRCPVIGRRQFGLVSLRGKITEPTHFWEIDDGFVSTHDFERELDANGLAILLKAKRFSRVFYILKKAGAKPV